MKNGTWLRVDTCFMLSRKPVAQTELFWLNLKNFPSAFLSCEGRWTEQNTSGSILHRAAGFFPRIRTYSHQEAVSTTRLSRRGGAEIVDGHRIVELLEANHVEVAVDSSENAGFGLTQTSSDPKRGS